MIVYPKGVWDKDDFLTLNIDPHNSAADSLLIQREGSHAVKVPLTTIDKLVAELKLERVDFIKMDIEGAEMDAILGAKQLIRAYQPALAISVYHTPSHIWEIPLCICKIAEQNHIRYKYHLRAHAQNCFDSIFYAIPERSAL